MSKIAMKIPKGYIRLQEKYDLSNDQNLRFVFNLLSPNKKIISVFLAKEDLAVYDKMIKDYKNITSNLELKKKFNIKIGEKTASLYIIGKESFFAQMFFQLDDKLYSFVSTIEKFEPSYEKLKKESISISDLVGFVRALK